MVAGDFAKILLSLDASAVDFMLLQKLAQALRFYILISFLYRLSFVWYILYILLNVDTRLLSIFGPGTCSEESNS